MIDFLPGVEPYESTVVELFPSGKSVRMLITLDPMHKYLELDMVPRH
jgi:hypothetical protein